MKKIILSVWLIACICEFLVPYILGGMVKGYSHMKTVMSAIATKKNGIIAVLYSGWLIVFGIIVIIVMTQIWRSVNPIRNYKIALILWLLYGLGVVVCGIFPVDETRKMVTTSAKIHGFTAVFTFFMIMFIPLFLKNVLLEKGYRQMVPVSYITTIVSFVVFVLQIISERENYVGTFWGNTGLWQRTYLLIQYLYMFAVMYLTLPS